jgi:RNA-binding protein YlmH
MESAFFWGGYPQAERACLFLLPDYLTACLSASPSKVPFEELEEMLEEPLSQAVCGVRIQGSGFRTLNHRDYLGSVLGLGIQRDAIGDIAVQDDHSAVLFCPARLADFFVSDLTKVASDTVRCRRYTPDESFTDGRKYRPISDTVASARLDCVVAALTNLSREAAQNAIRSGLVEVDFEPVERTDFPMTPPMRKLWRIPWR